MITLKTDDNDDVETDSHLPLLPFFAAQYMCTVCTKTYSSLSDVVAESMAGGTTVYICRTCCNGDESAASSGQGGEQPLNMCVKTRKRTRSEEEEVTGGGRGGEGAGKKENPAKQRRSGDDAKKYR